MNELNECIALLGVSGSLDRKNRKFLYILSKRTYKKILLAYFVHTLSYKRPIAYL